MHIRGCSKKDVIDDNKHLMIFLLHDQQLYQWSQHSQQLKLVCQTVSKEFAPEFDGCFYLLRDMFDKSEKTGEEIVKFVVNYNELE